MPFDPDKYLATKQAAPAFDPDAYLAQGQDVPREAPAPQGEPSSGMLWPISYSAEGEPSFDPSAGIMGAVGRAFNAPGEVWRGELDPTSPEGMQRATEFAAMATPISAASRAGVGFAGAPKAGPKGGHKTVTPAAPTRQALSEATTAGYKQVADLDVKYTAPAVEKMATELESALNEKGLIAGLKGVKDVHTLIGTIKGGPEGSYVKMSSLDALRQGMGDLAGSPKKQVRRAASQAIDAIDDFIAHPSPEALVDRAVTAGGKGVVPRGQSFAAADAAANKALAEKASKLILEARGNAAAGFRADKIAELEEVMGLRADASGSGMNLDNTTRQKLVSLLHSAGGKGVRGFNDTEKQAITGIIEGTKTKNLLRRTGNLLGGGGGIGQFATTVAPAATVGMATGSPMAAIAAAVPGAIGATAKTASNRMAQSEIDALGALIRARSPLGQQTMIPQQVYAPSIAPETMAKALGAQAMAQPAVQNGAMNRERMIRAVGRAPGPGGYY